MARRRQREALRRFGASVERLSVALRDLGEACDKASAAAAGIRLRRQG